MICLQRETNSTTTTTKPIQQALEQEGRDKGYGEPCGVRLEYVGSEGQILGRDLRHSASKLRVKVFWKEDSDA